MEVYHETPRRALRPYESILTPVITLILDAIAAHCAVGGSFAPGVRALAEWANVSEGAVSPNLYALAEDRWIKYDGHVIMLLRSPDQWIDQSEAASPDQSIDRGDQDVDRPSDQSVDRDQRADQPQAISPLIGGVQRSRTRKAHVDQSSDRSERHMVNHDLAAAAESKIPAAAISLKLPCADENDQPPDRSPAALVLAELGASRAVIADALRSRPDLTPEQIQSTAEHFARRVDAGLCGPGAFFGAIRRGEIHRAPPPRPAPAPVNDAGDDEAAMHAAYHRARALAPPGLSHAAMTELIYAILDGATDEQALDLIAAGGAS